MADRNKIMVILVVLVSIQGLSAGICWLMFQELFIASTFAGSLLPAAVYLKSSKI